jgi:quercetin dioxygenase-like cupin family protein
MTEPHTFLADLVTNMVIPEQGTLSKVVFKDDRIRVVAFAFDEGQELTEHTAAMPAVVQVLVGCLRLTMGSETFECKPGDWAHMAAGLPHSVLAREPSVMVLTLLRDPT